jgi:hypothetical protein
MEKNNLNPVLQILASRLNLTDHNEEPEEYSLTKEEEEKVVNNAITAAKQRRSFKLAQAGYNVMEIEAEINKIKWDERIDIPELLSNANSNKQYDIWQKSQREKDKKEAEEKKNELLKRCTAKYFFNLMAWVSKNVYEKDLLVNKNTSPLITAICFFMSKDHRFETELKYSFKKGLLVRGIAGLGKTFLFKCIQQNELNPFPIYSMIDIQKAVKAEGEFEIDIDRLLYLDDVGTEEPVVNHYGTKINFFKNFIENYYLQKQDFSNLIISTNNNFDGLEGKYGFRVRSRIKDMFNIIDVIGEDLRGL